MKTTFCVFSCHLAVVSQIIRYYFIIWPRFHIGVVYIGHLLPFSPQGLFLQSLLEISRTVALPIRRSRALEELTVA